MEKNLILSVSRKKNSADINLIISDPHIMTFALLGNWFFKYVCLENIVTPSTWRNKWYHHITAVATQKKNYLHSILQKSKLF